MKKADDMLKVREYAHLHGLPEWRVRRAIIDGDLKVDRRRRPMRIIGGSLMTPEERYRIDLEKRGQTSFNFTGDSNARDQAKSEEREAGHG